MISDFSLFETNLPQLQQLFNKQTKTRGITPKDLQGLCTTLNILPDLIGQSTLRMLIAQISGSAVLSKVELHFPEFLEVWKQIALTSFSSAPSIKEKCRRFFSHIAVPCKEEFMVSFVLMESLQRSKTLESTNKVLSNRKSSRKISKESNFFLEDKHREPVSPLESARTEVKSQLTKMKSARVKNNDKNKNSLKITINLTESKPITNNTITPTNNTHRKHKAITQKYYLRQPISRTYSANQIPNKAKKKKTKVIQKEEPSVNLDKIKTVYTQFKENHNDQVRVQNSRSQLSVLQAHRKYISRQMNAMFRNDIVLGLIFRAWRNFAFKLNN